MKENYVKVHGNKIRYLEDGKGPDIVLIHGLGSQAERWTNMIPILSKNHHVIAPDLIGFGFSDKPQVEYNPDYYVQFVFGFLQEVGIKKTVMVGSSLGGQIVAESAALDDSAIKKIILISPTGTMRFTNPTLETYIMAAMYPQRDMIRNAFGMMAGTNKDVDEPTISRFYEAMSRPNAKMAFLSTVIEFKHWPAITQRLQNISIPSLVVWGAKDTMIPVNFADEYVSNLKNCEFVLMEGCGHRPHVENPTKLADIIQEFLCKKITAKQCIT